MITIALSKVTSSPSAFTTRESGCTVMLLEMTTGSFSMRSLQAAVPRRTAAAAAIMLNNLCFIVSN